MTGLRDSDPETCILCGSGTVPRLSGRMAPNLAEYGTRQCLSCGLEFIDPVPSTETLFSIYNGEYRLHQHDNETMSNPMLGNRLGQRIRSAGRRLLLSIYERRFGRPIAKRLPGGSGRVLEIGFGAGATLERLYAQGWNVTGLEVAEGPVLSARERMPAGTFLRGTIDEKISSVGVFDLILLYHVLEHLDDPVGALMLMRQSLDDHGTLVVAVPNRDSLTRRLFGARWYGYRHPEHLLQFSERSLRLAVEEAGLRIRTIRPQPYFLAFGDSFANVIDPTWSRAVLTSAISLLTAPLGFAAVLFGDAAALEIEIDRA